MTVRRVWRGWTSAKNADAYQHVLLSQVIPMIKAKQMPEFRSIEVLREDRGAEVEFSTIMTFDTLEGVKAFMGKDYAQCHVPQIARDVLTRWDDEARHYQQIDLIKP